MEEKEREPVWVPIVQTLRKLPGGKIIIPLIIGSIIVTICSACGVKDPWGQIGSPTVFLFSSTGITVVLGFMLFFTGTQIDIRKMKPMLGRGFPLLLLRLGIAYTLCYLYFRFIGSDGLLLISFVAFTSCLTSTNAGMFMGLVNGYGDDADYSYFGVLLLTALPAFPMILIESSNGGTINYMSMLSILLPIVFGILLGNPDPNIRKIFKHGNDCVIPFLGFQFGSAINITVAAKMIPQGLILIACWYLLGVLPSYLLERFVMKRPGYISLGSSAMAGVALSIPPLAVEVGLLSKEQESNALAMLALVLVVTSILCPLLTDFNNRKYYASHKEHCLKKFPSFAKYIDKELVLRDSEKQKKRVNWARKFIAKEKLSQMEEQERKAFLQKEKEDKRAKRQAFKEALKKMNQNERRLAVRKAKMDAEDALEAKNEIYHLMAEKKEQDYKALMARSTPEIYQEIQRYKLLDTDRKAIYKELLKKESDLIPFEELSKHDIAIRTLEEYEETEKELKAIDTISMDTVGIIKEEKQR